MFKFIFSVSLLLQLQLQTECLYAGESCVALQQHGTCIPLLKCKQIADEVRRAGSPMPHHIRNQLLNLACGFELNEPMICCVSSQDTTQAPDFGPHQGVGTDSGSGPSDAGGFIFSNEEQPNNNNSSTRKPDPLVNRMGPKDIDGHPNINLLPTKQCGIVDGDRIVGGNRTRLFEMPFMVLLSYDSDRGQKLSCGGTIISKWYILTAAHCVSYLSSNLRLEGVRVGEYDVRHDPDCEMSDELKYCAPSVMNYTIDSVIAHPGYSPKKLVDDIALLRLSQPLDFSLDSVKPICLPITGTLQREALAGKNGVVAGWGVTEDGLQSPVLLSVDLPILSQQECEAAFNGSLQIRDTQLCAGGVKNKDSCGGDSGGPMLYPSRMKNFGVRYIQRGIVSFGSKRCGIARFPGVYTNVAYYMDWILDNIRN